MKRLFAGIVATTIGFFGLANSAHADVRDNARLFSPETVSEARATIKDIESKFKHSVTVETFAAIPDDKKAALEQLKKNKSDPAEFFQQWVQERAKASGARGVFILIVKSPGHVEVLADRETRAKEFTTVDAQDLSRQMVNDFKEKRFDAGLLAALDSIRTTMQAHHHVVRQAPIAKPSANPQFKPVTNTEKGTSIMGLICLVCGVVLFFWVIIGLIRSFTGQGRSMNGMGYQNGPPGYAPMMGGGGGGGMFNNFLGGMFGAVAGNWMYNSFFGGGHHQSGGGWDSPAFGGDRSVGGDFGGDDAGVGDFSGGGGAGGDFGDGGGGDYGGGGGDFGGGGGDFGGGGDWGGGGGDFGGGDTGGGGDF